MLLLAILEDLEASIFPKISGLLDLLKPIGICYSWSLAISTGFQRKPFRTEWEPFALWKRFFPSLHHKESSKPKLRVRWSDLKCAMIRKRFVAKWFAKRWPLVRRTSEIASLRPNCVSLIRIWWLRCSWANLEEQYCSVKHSSSDSTSPVIRIKSFHFKGRQTCQQKCFRKVSQRFQSCVRWPMLVLSDF